VLLAFIIAILAILLPGIPLAFGLLKKTGLPRFEIIGIGVIFGLLFPPTLVWLEAYFIGYVHAFSFSEWLYNADVVALTVIGVLLCIQQGVIKIGAPAVGGKATEKTGAHAVAADSAMPATETADSTAGDRPHHKKSASPGAASFIRKYAWVFLLVLVLLTFLTRVASIGIAPKFFEFDPYYDMQSTQYILTYGQQLLHDHSAWPTLVNGSIHRIQPLIPYLEAYWYELASGGGNTGQININLLATVGGLYPPIVAALLVFVVFMLLYHDYGTLPALTGAALTAGMPALVTTFIAGEQLLEPWGIFSMFFFYATYLLAVKNPKQVRYAILAGLAFASTFLGAHYYTVTVGVLAIYILLQGIINVLWNKDMFLFFRMNAIVIAVEAIFYMLYAPYGATLTSRIPAILGIPIMISFPLLAMFGVWVFGYLSKVAKPAVKWKEAYLKTAILALLLVVGVIMALFTPLGKPIQSYIALSEHFTTPSIPLFMTVQEYAPTGIMFDFGNGGFGLIGASIGAPSIGIPSIPILIWAVLILFIIFMVVPIILSFIKLLLDEKGPELSESSILYVAIVMPLAIAGMIEVKYLPHFGVAYIIAICVILGEVLKILKVKNQHPSHQHSGEIQGSRHGGFSTGYIAVIAVVSFMVLFELGYTLISVGSAAINPNCTSIASTGNSLGYNLFCMVVPNYWLNATAWMRSNVGPNAPRILSWWDYGDWINWFGNSNAVLRGDNAVATLDYATAAQYVLGKQDGYNASTMARFMNSIQSKYILFDNQLMQKWQALDFLACIDVNQTKMSYAESQGALHGLPYLLGTSQCELKHDPVFALVPVDISSKGFTTAPSSLQLYCKLNSSSGAPLTAVTTFLAYGSTIINQTYCVSTSFYSSSGPSILYNQNGTPSDAVIIPSSEFYYGTASLSGQAFEDFMVIYKPNGPDSTVVGAPTEFYNSNYYRGFIFGKLDGFHLVYPSSFSGINYLNSTNQVMIFALNNYSGTLPYVAPKPAWVNNTYEMPG
jgi:asparagine N-glycosylation enzyme membrane subunit Stt3